MASDAHNKPSLLGGRLAGIGVLIWFVLIVAAALYAADTPFTAWVDGLMG